MSLINPLVNCDHALTCVQTADWFHELFFKVSFLPKMFCICAFVQDAQIEKEKSMYNISGGCTALVVIYLQGKLYVGNAGDGR